MPRSRSLRGLYVIRGGASPVTLVRQDEEEPDAPAEETEETEETEAPADGRLATLEVDFSRFNTWYRIDSWFEGTFIERTLSGSFLKTIDERGDQVKVLFNHGFDFSVGDKLVSVPEVLEEREESPHLEGPLFDTSYNRDLLPGLRAGAYGSSFMFEVLGESWDREPEASDYNPDALPERTISEVRLFEAGPVTWPANPEATAGIRSGSDWYLDQLQQRDEARYDGMVRTFSAFRAMNGLSTPLGAAGPKSRGSRSSAPTGRRDGMSASARQRKLTLIDMAR
ncbi:MAG TPA: HK97 family phage prohead protease [Jiangellaceae bacterium]|nr:HK97 family phage prohead protease [Jiangellaceae bacterium]